MPSKENSGIINSNQYSLFSSDCIPHCQCRRTFFDFSTLWNIFRSPKMGWKSDLIWFSLSSTQYFSCRYNVHEILAFLCQKGLYSRQVVHPVRLSQFPLHKATRGMRHFIRLPWQFVGHFYSWEETGTVRIWDFVQEWSGLEPRPLDLESSTLT